MTDIATVRQKMQASLDSFMKNMASVRAGRATPDLLNPIKVEAYNDFMPLNQLATVNNQDPTMLTVQVWDKTLVSTVEKAIMNANMGFNPACDGDVIKIPMPKLSAERREELVKICSGYLENVKIAMRNIRRDGIESVKKQQKDSEISEDDAHRNTDEIQKIIDDFTKQAEELFDKKKTDIMHV
jgi:ribosome recycling factor